MRTQLYEATTAVLGGVTPFRLDPAPTAAQRAAGLDATVSVAFRGPLSGRLVLRTTPGLLPALGELATGICGSVLPAITGAAGVFQLAAPQPLDPAILDDAVGDAAVADVWGTLAAAAEVGLGGGRAEVLLFVDAIGADVTSYYDALDAA